MKNRTEALRQLAFQLNLKFSEKDEFGLAALLQDFELFQRGRRRAITNILTSRDTWLDERVTIFDYKYVKGKSNSRRTFRQTVFFIQSKSLGLPQLLMKPETLLHKVGAWFGIKDINFEAFPEFSKQYYLKGEDEGYIRYIMNEEVLEYFTHENNWHLEGVNYFMALYRKKQLISPAHIKQFYQKGMEVYHKLKLPD